jgi:hypothetical protein
MKPPHRACSDLTTALFNCGNGNTNRSPGEPCSASNASSLSGRTRPTGSGRLPNWLKMKNPAAPAVREAEEDWA